MISIMTKSDLDEVMSIAQASSMEESPSSTPWSRRAFEREVCFPFSHPFIAQEANRIVGFIIVWVILHEAHVAIFAVDPQNSGRGIGSGLLHHVLNFCRRELVHEITVIVRKNNGRAVNIYSRAGFKKEGIRPNLFNREGGFEDGILMSLFLTPNPATELFAAEAAFMREILESINSSKILRENHQAQMALQASDALLHQKHMLRIAEIQRSRQILESGAKKIIDAKFEAYL